MINKHQSSHLFDPFMHLLALAIAAAFFIYPLLFQNMHSYILLSSDAGNVASILAAWLSPDSFEKDIVFSNPHHYQFYISCILYIAYGLNLLIHDIGMAFHILLIPLIYAQIVGFYILGKRIFADKKTFAFLLTLSNLAYINLGGGEYWGIYSFEALSRSFINAFLPFFLLFLIHLEYKPKQWWLLFLALAIGFYFHTVSVPTLAFALAFTLFFKPYDVYETLSSRFKYVALGSVLFLLAVLPFIYFYINAFVADNKMTDAMIGAHVGQYFKDSSYALSVIFNSKLDWLIIILGYIGFYKDKSDKAQLLGLFLSGIILGSVGLAYLDQTIAAFLGRSPLQFDLIRNMRFIFPLSFIGIGFLLYSYKKIGMILFACLIFLMLYKNPLHYFVKPLKKDYSATELQNLFTYSQETQKHNAYFKKRPKGSTVLPIGNPRFIDIEALSFRYQALQPVVYTRKDRNFLIYTNSTSYPKWEKRHKIIQNLSVANSLKTTNVLLKVLIQETNTDYIYLDKTFGKKALLIETLNAYAEPVFETENRTLFKVKK